MDAKPFYHEVKLLSFSFVISFNDASFCSFFRREQSLNNFSSTQVLHLEKQTNQSVSHQSRLYFYCCCLDPEGVKDRERGRANFPPLTSARVFSRTMINSSLCHFCQAAVPLCAASKCESAKADSVPSQVLAAVQRWRWTWRRLSRLPGQHLFQHGLLHDVWVPGPSRLSGICELDGQME